MDKIKELLLAYEGFFEFIFGIIPGVKGLSPNMHLALKTLFIWVLIPILLISVVLVFLFVLKWLAYTLIVLLLLWPAIVIGLKYKEERDKQKDEE